MSGPIARRRRRHGRGQALIEVAIALPFLVVLLAGSAQFGSVAFGQVTIDTAAREGARTAVDHPVTALGSFFNKNGGPTTTTCQNASSYPSNPVCEAVLASPGNYGLLGFDPSKFVITVTANQPSAGPWSRRPSDDIVLASLCGGTEVKGSVNLPDGSNAHNATVTASGTGVTGTPTSTDGSGGYTLCLSVPTLETVTVSATLSVGGCPETAQVSTTMPSNGNVSNVNLTLGTCSTTTTTTSTTSTSTTTITTTATVTSSSVSATPYTCTQAQRDLDGTYVSVKVSYPMPIFVPFVGGIFADSGGGVRTVTSQVTMRVSPCTYTQGQ